MRQFCRCLSIVLAASFCATLLWTPPAAAEDAAATAVQAAAANNDGVQIAQANPFSDVPQNSWAYDAVRQLAAAGLITGYPDNTFKGNRPMTRYEMAVLVNRAVNAIQSKIAGGGTVSAADLAAVKKLVDAFGPELQQVQAQLRALQQQQAALKTQADATKAEADAVKAANDQMKKQLTDDEVALRAATSALAASHAGYSAWYRAYTGSQLVGVGQGGGAGVPVVAPASASFGTLGGTASVPTGALARSFQYQGFRFNLSGAPDPRIQFGLRVESIIRTDSLQTGGVGTTAGYCTNPLQITSSFNCQTQDYNGTLPGETGANYPARIAYSWFGYFSPGGFFAKVGRISEDEGRNADGVALGGAQANGVQLGYKDSRLYGYAFLNTQATAASNLAAVGIASGNNSTNGLNPATAAAATSGNGPGSLCPFGYPGNFPAGTAGVAGSSAANLSTGTGAGYGAAADCMNQGVNGIAGMLEYYLPSSRTAVGFTYDGYNAVPYEAWNPYAGLCTGATGAAKPGTTSTAGAGIATWNTNVVGNNGYCPSGYQPLVYAAGSPNAGAPVTGAYQYIVTNVKTSSVYGIQYFGPHDSPTWRLTGEYLWRYGNDPTSAANCTGLGAAAVCAAPSAWKDNGYGFVELAYASKGNFNGGPLIPSPGIRGSNFVVAQYYDQGLNAIGLDNGVAGTLAYQSTTFYTNYAGTNEFALTFGRWFTNNFRAGFTYSIFSNRGVPIPAGSTTCPTCVVNGLVTRAIGLDTYLVW